MNHLHPALIRHNQKCWLGSLEANLDYLAESTDNLDTLDRDRLETMIKEVRESAIKARLGLKMLAETDFFEIR